MPIEQVQRPSTQFENLNGRLGPALDPKLFACRLNPLYSHSARQLLCMWKGLRQRGENVWLAWIESGLYKHNNSAWKGIGGVIIEMLVYVLQTR